MMAWSPPQKQHRIGSYNKGCKCDSCMEAGRLHGRRYRDAQRRNTPRPAGAVVCPICGMWFMPRGYMGHLKRCEAEMRGR